MSQFTDTFDNLAAWSFGTSVTTEFTVTGSFPPPYDGSSRSNSVIDEFGGTSWAAARFDVADGNNPAKTYWISYAFYFTSAASLAANYGTGGFLRPFGFLTKNADPMDVNTLAGGQAGQTPLISTDGATVQIWADGQLYMGLPAATLTGDNQWHTIRYGLRLDDDNSQETMYLDDTLLWSTNVLYGTFPPGWDASNGVAGVLAWGNDTADPGNSFSFAMDPLVYDSEGDPGEPPGSNTPANPCTGEGLLMRVELDEVDVTDVCVRGAWTPRLNRPAQATVTIPMELAGGDTGSRLKFYLVDGSSETLVFHGLVLNVETTADKDTGYTQYNAQDPMELWQWRPVRDDGADFSKPDIITAYQSGPQILQAMLINTVDSTGRTNTEGETGGPPPTDAEGPIFLTLGTFDGGGPDLSGAPTDWPMTIGELFSLLVSTGQLDAVIVPSELGANDEMGTVSGYNGDFGTDLSGDVLFSYGMGARNVSGLRWNRDMTNMVNKYWIYGGPRISTAGDPAGDQHWCFNITGFDLAFDATATVVGAWANATNYTTGDVVTNGAPTVNYIARQTHTSSAATEPGVGANWPNFWLVWLAPPGGVAVDTSNNPVGPPWTNNQLGERIFDSRTSSAGVRMKVDIFDAYDDDCFAGVNAAAHELYKYQWQTYSWFSAIPRDIIHVTPVPDVYIGCFGIGDLIGIEASSEVRGGFSGAQRVYEYTVSWEGTASVLTLSELQVSSDAEGLFN